MGWLVGWSTKAELIEHIDTEYRTANVKVLDKHIGSRGVWYLAEGTINQGKAPRRIIELVLMENFDGEWGYKTVSELSGPGELDCPIRFIKAADPVERDGHADKWRQKVIAKHAEKLAQRKARPTYKAGQFWQIGGELYQLVEPAGKRLGWVVKCQQTGNILRAPYNRFANAQLVA